jgi:hypothetical protein
MPLENTGYNLRKVLFSFFLADFPFHLFNSKMAYNYTQALLVSLAFAVLVLIVGVLRIGRRPAGYPPGPPTLPLLGNIHLVLLYHYAGWPELI